MSAGSEFHTVGAATWKLRAPKSSLCDGTHNKFDWNVNCDQVHSYEVNTTDTMVHCCCER